MDVNSILKQRYSTKEFDPEKKFTKSQIEDIKNILKYSPSSTNVQPWHFVIAETQEAKKKVSKAAQGFYGFNEEKVLNASADIIFCGKKDISDDFLEKLTQEEDEDGRYPQKEFKEKNSKGRETFVNMHKHDYDDLKCWVDNQVYLSLGYLLFGAAVMGIDSLAMEGCDMKILNEEFSLNQKGFEALCVVALGYHKDSDFNIKLPKSRLDDDQIFTCL